MRNKYGYFIQPNEPPFPNWKFLIAVIVFTLIATIIYARVARAEVVNTSMAVIHHSASPDVSVKTIDKWHKERGFNGIGYHFVIRQDGRIEKGRPLTKVGAHAKGRNKYIGICLTGYDKFTKAQIKSLITLLNDLSVRKIEPHHEKCPGKGLDLGYITKHITPIVPLVGKASLYTDRKTANGETFLNNLSCATKTANYGMKFKVTNLENGKSIIVRNNDFGPHKPGRIIDLTPTAFSKIAPISQGIIPVRIEALK